MSPDEAQAILDKIWKLIPFKETIKRVFDKIAGWVSL